MDTIFLSAIPDSKGTTMIQKLYASDTILDNSQFNQYVLLKISDNAKILCKIIPRVICSNVFASCDPSVIKHAPHKLINPLTVKLEMSINKEHIEPIGVANSKRMVVSVVFKDVKHQHIWSKNLFKLADAINNLLRLFVVHNDCVVNLKRLKLKQNFNIDFILVHKTDCKNNAARINSDTTIMVIKTMSAIQFYQAEIGLEVPPLFGMESQVKCLKSIIKAAKNGCSPLCNMILLIGPSGSGKTRLVTHVSASLKCILFDIISTDLVKADPGSTESVIRGLFKRVQLLLEQDSKIVCIIMLEKAESMLNSKSSNAKRICAQIQDCLTSIKNSCRIIVIATTSMPHLIDASFKQGSRFSYEIYIGVPSEKERVKLIQGFCGILNINIKSNIVSDLAKLTPGYTSADLELIFKEILNESNLISELEMGILYGTILLIAKYPASSLRSGIGQVITKSESCSTTTLGGLTNVKLMLDVCIKWPLIHPKAFKYFAVPPPKGVLLYGPPGCGKTSLVRSIASSANLNVLTAMAAELYSPYLGVTEANISQLFQRARANVPAVLFIDEIDSLVSCRSEGNKGSSGFDDRVLSTFLVEMDGITNDTEHGQGVVIVAATNRPDNIDTALLRPGRFDRQIYVPPPQTIEERFNILHTIVNNPQQSMPLSDSSILNEVALMTDRFSAADLAIVVKEAGLSCLTKDGLKTFTTVKKEHFEDALANVKPSLSEEQILWYNNFSSRQKQ
ncbi:ATPase family gene 2 protein homolog B-like [Rhopalosiphum padi]|uniref:ATPase family gene 2 protein homolog B-like n=1 Tax=Rhopalosiphum padi TaxID=40932 RepID=UPI00298E497B|nr:ATPase family gene 2 protein homolog B-like [Rhopalosiphum padi]